MACEAHVLAPTPGERKKEHVRVLYVLFCISSISSALPLAICIASHHMLVAVQGGQQA